MKALGGIIALLALLAGGYFIYNNYQPTAATPMQTTVTVTPISHASLALAWDGLTVYADPVGDAAQYAALPRPDIIVVTHEHGDHFSTSTLSALMGSTTALVTSQSVAEKLPEELKTNLTVMTPGDTKEIRGITIEAIPAYNIRQEALERHPHARNDNGYVLEYRGERIYIAGDTEDTPEMRALKNIDIAFVPMNLPYTMTVEKAAEGVLAFAPRQVYPYHYRGMDGLSDINTFKQLVDAGNKNIEVVFGNWYAE